MTKDQLVATLANLGYEIDDFQGGAGNFRDIFVGTGRPTPFLWVLRNVLKQKGCDCDMQLDFVDVPSHPDFGKAFLRIKSFWWE